MGNKFHSACRAYRLYDEIIRVGDPPADQDYLEPMGVEPQFMEAAKGLTLLPSEPPFSPPGCLSLSGLLLMLGLYSLEPGLKLGSRERGMCEGTCWL